MSYTLTVGGTEKYVQQDTLEISKALTYQVDTMKATIMSSTRPSEGDEVIVTDSTLGVLFGGIIVSVKLRDKDADTWEIDCNDYTELVDRKLVTETYENESASAIVKDIIAKYTVGLLDSVTTGAPLVEYIPFNYVRPSECFKQLCDYVGWQWYIDETKHIKFFDAASLLTPTPINLVDGTRSQWGDFKFSIDMQNLRNRVYVLGGSMYSDPATFEFVADGSQTLFNLGHKPHNLSMTVNAVAVTVGIENINEDDGTYDYLMNYQEKYVRCGSGTSAPANGTTIAVTYQYDIPVITFYEDKDSQDALKAVQGGDGVYEHMINDDSIVTLEAAQALAVRDMRDNANPKVKGSFITLEPGWEPGQILTVTLSDRGINNSYMVQSVRIHYAADWFWTVEFGGRLMGIADFLQALISKQQKADQDTAIINKIKSNTETVSAADTTTTTINSDAYLFDGADALWDFAVFS